MTERKMGKGVWLFGWVGEGKVESRGGGGGGMVYRKVWGLRKRDKEEK